MLLFVVLFVISFFFFGSFDDSEGSNLMGTGIMSILGSATVAGLLAGRICGLLRISVFVPLGALALFVIIGFVMVGMNSFERRWSEQADRMREETERDLRTDLMTKIRQKKERNEARGRPVLERAKEIASSGAWIIDDTNTYCHTTRLDDDSQNLTSADQVPETLVYKLDGASRKARGQSVSVSYDESAKKWSAKKWTVSSSGSDENFILRNAYHEIHRGTSDYYYIHDAPLEALRPGPLREIANDLANALKQAIEEAETVRLAEAQKRAASEAVAANATRQQNTKSNGKSRSGWIVGVLIAGVVVSGGAGFLVWKRR